MFLLNLYIYIYIYIYIYRTVYVYVYVYVYGKTEIDDDKSLAVNATTAKEIRLENKREAYRNLQVETSQQRVDRLEVLKQKT